MNPFIRISLSKTLFTQEGPKKMEYELELSTGELLGVFGSSGVGKTTLLRMLAGLESPDEGYLMVGGQVWFDSAHAISLPPEQRRVGMVFQQHHLFPHMTILQNLKFARQPESDLNMIPEILDALGLLELQNRRPGQLSGGQCQRAALARTLVSRPKILLLDEPFSSLDWSLRWKLQAELKRWHIQFQSTTLFVSHDFLELSRVADRIYVMGEHDGNPEEFEQAAEHYLKLSKDFRYTRTGSTVETEMFSELHK